ncbi:unnamed protein product [Vitrella brassicaformis CCMP3155]|uniref:Uncharacterized protein n=1 Tax=Vitrella brassicaformis (strain CCMP3155) TaxID=1169540 RepID=A0A0G4E870_VITBC|nr:unnamed protein product [Vitrella brassicaformis CCMP3155]|eukprot:CEL91723.1 unnamed protein product [Vitrella brassicaformis CCMP3155]
MSSATVSSTAVHQGKAPPGGAPRLRSGLKQKVTVGVGRGKTAGNNKRAADTEPDEGGQRGGKARKKNYQAGAGKKRPRAEERRGGRTFHRAIRALCEEFFQDWKQQQPADASKATYAAAGAGAAVTTTRKANSNAFDVKDVAGVVLDKWLKPSDWTTTCRIS